MAAASAFQHIGHSDIQNFGSNIPKAHSCKYPETEYSFVPFLLQIKPHSTDVETEHFTSNGLQIKASFS
jgi:hypothetical protein